VLISSDQVFSVISFSSFKWGGVAGFQTFQPAKAIEIASGMYKRRNLEFTDAEERL
jgi:hypothetical protein